MTAQIQYAYLFEVSSIQAYILEGGRLRDMVAASEMLEQLLAPGAGPLDAALHACDIDQKSVCRRAGGVLSLLLTDVDHANAFATLWSLLVQQRMPGLVFNQVIAEATNAQLAVQASYEKLHRQPPAKPVLPIAGPLVERAPRTGAAAVCQDTHIPNTTESVGASINTKRHFFKAMQRANNANFQLDQKFQPPNGTLYRFPTDFEDDFDFGSSHDIAVIHADGNSIGVLVQNALKSFSNSTDYICQASRFSNRLSSLAESAAQQATAAIAKQYQPSDKKFKGTLPMRPLVLGGDDLSILIRADLAMPFVQTFLQAFEQQTAKFANPQSKADKNTANTPLTACAGVVFIKYNQPFTRAYTLAESCCNRAKELARASIDPSNASNATPSCVVFHRVTAAFMDEYTDALDRELTVGPSNERTCMTLGAYGVGQFAAALAPLDSLLAMVNLLKNETLRRGPLRSMLTSWTNNPQQAERQYQNWCKQLKQIDGGTQALQHFNTLAKSLHLSVEHGGFPYRQIHHEAGDLTLPQKQTALLDLLNLRAIEGFKDAQ